MVCGSLRRSGIMVTRSLFGFESAGKRKLVRAEGLERSRTLAVQRIFIPCYGFRRRPPLSQWGSGSELSLHRARIWLQVSGAARLVSTPSRPFRPGLARIFYLQILTPYDVILIWIN